MDLLRARDANSKAEAMKELEELEESDYEELNAIELSNLSFTQIESAYLRFILDDFKKIIHSKDFKESFKQQFDGSDDSEVADADIHPAQKKDKDDDVNQPIAVQEF